MNKKITWLTGVLGLQLALAISLFLFGGTNYDDFKQVSLLPLAEKSIDKLVISDGKEIAKLEKSDAGWILPGLQGLGVSQSKIEAVLARLQALKANWPVATTSSSHQRFEVAEDKFQRKLELYSKGKLLGTLYIGTSPGFKKSHVRKAGDDAVYALGLNAYDLPALAKDWLDTSLLAAKDVKHIKSKTFELTKDAESWRFANVGKDEQVDQEKAAQLSQALSSIRVTGVAENPPALQGDTLVTLDVGADKNISYQLLAADGKYYIKRSDIEPVFTLSKAEYERLNKTDRAYFSVAESTKSDSVAKVSGTDAQK